MVDLPTVVAQEAPGLPQDLEPNPQLPPSFSPQIVIENLPDSASGLTQPWATLIAGGLAIVAAAIAYAGIRYQVKQNALATQKQIDQQRMAVEREIEATDRREARTNRLDRLTEASQALSAAVLVAIQFDSRPQDSMDDSDYARLVSALDACEHSELMLQLVGATTSAEAIRAAIDKFRLVLKFDGSVTSKELMKAFEAARAAFRSDTEPSVKSNAADLTVG